MLHLFQELVDAGSIVFGVVEREMQIGNAAELQTLENFVANEAHSVFQSLDGSAPFRIGAAGRNKDPGVATVFGKADIVYHNRDFQTGITELARKHGIDFVSDFFS